MAQKRNRRRTRPRSKRRLNTLLNQDDRSPLAAVASPQSLCASTGSANIPLLYDPSSYNLPCYPPSSSVVQAWQIQDAARLEADRFRLFGGEPGDDVALCYRMLEYFGRLDYIDS
ncbi:hypothetical protein ACJ72_08109 [Emergomyces africanus]|uniref:Uncharacterized protein n=1 Tax=Emergomyces africanus TaxID=1955775 RepID=A0A1B7NL75_9EURO|nr:hypothetical protein ACJ72_08109 [Emergomyces africanus]